MSQIDYQLLADALLTTFKTASSTPNATLGHGPGGPFSTPGINRQVFNASVLPKLGLMSRLPVRSSVDVNPLHMILTGVTAVSGSNPSGDCDPCKVPGNAKRLLVKSTFGRFCLSTRTFNVTDIGSINNRGEFKDFQLVGNPFNAGTNDMTPTLPAAGDNPLNSELAKHMFEFKHGWAREFSKQLYAGNPVNNSGSYKEFRGLDILINSGYQDAETGAIAPAADSLVRNWNAAVTSGNFVAELTAVVRRQNYSADQMGLSPVQWALVMPEMLFYELTALWPCAYNTYRCSVTGNNSVNIDATAQIEMTQSMRDGMYLLIDGARVPVITDDAVAQTENSGTFTTTIYLVPLTVAGGTPSTYVEFFDFNNGDAAQVRSALGTPGKFIVTDGGRFIWVRRENGFCVSMDVVERSRVILETPFLAARITNVQYTPLIQTKSGYNTDTSRFYNGGSTSIPAPSFYAPTVYSN